MDNDTPNGLARTREALEHSLRAAGLARELETFALQVEKEREKVILQQVRQTLRDLEQAQAPQEFTPETTSEGE